MYLYARTYVDGKLRSKFSPITDCRARADPYGCKNHLVLVFRVNGFENCALLVAKFNNYQI